MSKFRFAGSYFLFLFSAVLAVLLFFVLGRMPHYLVLIAIIPFLLHFVAIMLVWIHGPLSWILSPLLHFITPSVFLIITPSVFLHWILL